MEEILLFFALKYQGDFQSILKALQAKEKVSQEERREAVAKVNSKYTTIISSDYPDALKEISCPPFVLFYKGNYNAIINENTLAIIGSREASKEGQKNAYEMAYLFAKENYSIVSGLAMGCDTYAHKGCLDANGMTVGVLSSGLDTMYPIQNRELAERIIENNGCLLSEYPIGFTSFKNNFIERDRIESGLSLGTIVIEANIKSGTMHTAKSVSLF